MINKKRKNKKKIPTDAGTHRDTPTHYAISKRSSFKRTFTSSNVFLLYNKNITHLSHFTLYYIIVNFDDKIQNNAH